MKRLLNEFVRVVRRTCLLYLIPLAMSVVEYFLIFHSLIFSSPLILPHDIELKYMLSITNGISYAGIIPVIVYFPLEILSIYIGLDPITFTGRFSIFNFEILYFGFFFSSKYFLRKYFNASGFLLYFIPSLVSVIVPITWYTVDGVIIFYPGVYALTLALLDYTLDINSKQRFKQALLRAAIAAIAVTLDFEDPRGIIYGVLTFFIFSLYFLIIKRGKRLLYLKEWLKVFFFGVLLFLLLNFSTIAYTEFVKPYIPLVGVSTVYNQLGIALQHVHPFYTLSGVMYWLGENYYVSQYHADLLLGTTSAAIGLTALLFRKPITMLLGVFVLSVAAYNFIGVTTLGYYLAQTPYVEYLVYLYPTYIPSYFFVAPFYLLVSFTFFMVGKYLYRGRSEVLRILKAVPALVLLVLPFLAFYSPLASSIGSQHSVPSPPSVIESIKLISSNDSGIVLVLGDSALSSYYLGLPSMLSPSFYGYMNFIWNGLYSAKNVAKFLSYFGIQYIVVLQPKLVGCYDLLAHDNDLVPVYNNSGVIVFENRLYKSFIAQKGVYIAFNFPEILTQVSGLNSTYVVVPFYYVNDLHSVLPYVKGFIGYNVSPVELVPMLVTNSSYVISASKIYLNQYYTNGWVHGSPFWTPDIMDSITEGNGEPLNLTLNIPDGKYYVFVLAVGYTFNQYTSGSIEIKSGNSLTLSVINSVYNVTWFLAGELNLTDHEMQIVDHNLGIVKVVLVPSSDFASLLKEAESILDSREVVSYVGDTAYIKQGNYTPSVYGIAVFANPWILYLPYAHVVDVGNYLYHSQYYFGTADVYVTKSDKGINTSYPSFLPELLLNFVIDIAIIFYVVYNRNLIY